MIGLLWLLLLLAHHSFEKDFLQLFWHETRYIGSRNQKGEVMTKTQLMKKIAVLESINDQLSAEVEYVDRLMRLLGFSEGLLTVKSTAQEIIDNGYLEDEE